MKTLRPLRSRAAAFTMVELALCIAVVAVAMVAIIGVLPLGINVQRENREDTIINQDAQFLLEAIRHGSIRVDELTNYVDYITVSTRSRHLTLVRTFPHFQYKEYGRLPDLPSPIGNFVFRDGSQVLGLLSLPKYGVLDGDPATNHVVAQMRALSGSLFEKTARDPTVTTVVRTSPDKLESAFRYLLTPEIVPISSIAQADPTASNPSAATRISDRRYAALQANLYEVRLNFQWPVVVRQGTNIVGNNRKTYRTQVAGRLLANPSIPIPGDVVLHYFQPDRYDDVSLR